MDATLLWYLSRSLHRDVQREELAFALGASISTITRRMRDGFQPDEVIQAARYFRLSPLDALVQLGYLRPSEIETKVETKDLSDYTDLEIATEMLRRVQDGSATRAATDPLAVAGDREAGLAVTASEVIGESAGEQAAPQSTGGTPAPHPPSGATAVSPRRRF